MLAVNLVSKTLGDHLVLDRVSFTLNRGERIGLVGPNGAGKTTLLSVVAGALPPDGGSVTLESRATLGYLRQGFADIEEGTLAALLDASLGGLLAAYARLEASAAALTADGPSADAALDGFIAATDAFHDAGGYEKLDELQTMLARFGLGGREPSTPLDRLSGGEKTRAGLAALLASSPDLLLLDEPTNHLDIDALGWLEAFLESYRGGVLIVSHDRAFLDRVATAILELDDTTHIVTRYAGNYSDYFAERARQADAQAEAFQRQQRAVARIERDIRAVAAHGQKTERETTNDYVRGRAKKVARTAKVRERKLERLLTSEELIDKPERRWGLALDFADAGETGRDVVSLAEVSVRFGERVVLDRIDLLIRSGERVALTGPNGAGKSTLLSVITGARTPDSGTAKLGAAVRIGLYDQEQQIVELGRSPLEQVRSAAAGEESDVRAFLHKFLFTGANVQRPARELSYGERARLALALLVRRGANVLILDEPLNHLDLAARERFEEALTQFEGTVIVVLHDRYAIERIATRVLELRDRKLVER
jgi:ATP-binding cassette subfamily F protein 3